MKLDNHIDIVARTTYDRSLRCFLAGRTLVRTISPRQVSFLAPSPGCRFLETLTGGLEIASLEVVTARRLWTDEVSATCPFVDVCMGQIPWRTTCTVIWFPGLVAGAYEGLVELGRVD